MDKIKIILSSMMVSLLAGFVIFQFERDGLLKQRGENTMRGVCLFAGAVDENSVKLFQDWGHNSRASQDIEGTRLAVFSMNGRLFLHSAGWDWRDDIFAASLLSGGKLREGFIVTEHQMSDSQYVFSAYPFQKNGERIGYVVIKERVSDVRTYLWKGFGKIMLISVVIGFVVSASGIVLGKRFEHDGIVSKREKEKNGFYGNYLDYNEEKM